jgi:antimicrobial peptide system SdpB family protein
LSGLLFTSDAELFVGESGSFAAARCNGIESISLWCAGDSVTGGFLVSRVLAVGILVVVISGYRPRWTCVPHWYVTFSLGSSILAQEGGDAAAKAATLLLIPICLGDTSVWQWARRPMAAVSPAWRGSAFAAHLMIRLQTCAIYATAAISKLADPAWAHGVAIYSVAYDPAHGFPPGLRRALAGFLGSFGFVATLSWLVIGVELAIALGIVGPRKTRLVSFVLAVGLHVSIGLLMGLPSFALAVIGLVSIAYGGGVHSIRPRAADVDGSTTSEEAGLGHQSVRGGSS